MLVNPKGKMRRIRGCGKESAKEDCSFAARFGELSFSRFPDLGFRVFFGVTYK